MWCYKVDKSILIYRMQLNLVSTCYTIAYLLTPIQSKEKKSSVRKILFFVREDNWYIAHYWLKSSIHGDSVWKRRRDKNR